MVGSSGDETNLAHKLLLTNRQVANFSKAFENYLSTDIKLSKTQLSEMMQSGAFLSGLLGPLLNTRLPLMKNFLQPPAKSFLLSLELTLIWMGFLGDRFEVRGGLKLPLCLKLDIIVLETSNLARKHRPICSFIKYTF